MHTIGHKKPGKTESRLSVAFMVILVIVGVGVFMRQFQINPGVVALRPESHPLGLPQESNQSALIDTRGSGITPFSPPERFGPDTLYEKINGRADLYLSSGFVSLGTQRFNMQKSTGNWIELFIYDMATPANAFSVFSMQRRENARTDDTIPKAYRTANALFMTHANVYLELIGTDASDDLQQAMGWLAQEFIKAHGGTTAARAPGTDLFAADGFKTDSIQLIASNAFGYEQLNQIYTAEYLIDGARLTAFISDRSTAEAASAMAVEYSQTLISYGAAAVDTPPFIDGAIVMQFFDTYEIVFNRGVYLAGVHEAVSLEAAIILARRLDGHLETHESK